MKKILLIFAIAVLSNASFGQPKRFEKDMMKALYIHDTAKTATSEVMALNEFKKLVNQYPDEWLPGYWTAYLCTQVARLDGRMEDFPEDLEGKQLLMEAKVYLTTAKKAKGNMDAITRSDFLMLDAFIHSFYEGMVAESDQEKEEYRKLSQGKYREAIKNNPRNPLMHVLTGISLTQKDDYRDVAAGIGLLDYAEHIFNQKDNRALTTYWNNDFIKFWRSRAENKLQELLDETTRNAGE